MIEYLFGPIARKSATEVVVDCAGVGYLVNVSLHTYEKLPASGTVRLLIHTHSSDSGERLFGFFEDGERALFRDLLSVRGVGPAIALTLLSHDPPARLVQRLRASDVKGLMVIKGIGRKTAERLVVELKDRLPVAAAAGSSTDSFSSLVHALGSLGLSLQESEERSRHAIKELGESTSIEVLLRRALRSDQAAAGR